ncbi:MAG TPA: phosphoribosylanthranilate isomerase [Lachnospiraceae bacterium]|nr:phosphoribosylanthranilate isomerase [Lachnospiraceae bacterium]
MVPKIKICGLVSVDDAFLMNVYEVDYIGIVLFFPKSKRNIDIDRAKEIIHCLAPGIKKVAVTVSPTKEQVREIEAAGFDILQAHGVLAQEVLDGTSIPILRAINISDESEFKMERSDRIIGYVFDGKISGGGKVFDWSVIKYFNREKNLLMLAGGLTPDNVVEGIHYIQPDIVDVSSGVEIENSIGKEEAKVKAFVEAVRGNNIKKGSRKDEQ